MRALQLAAIQPSERILEVAVGPGVTLLEIRKRVERDQNVSGVNLSPKMLRKTEKRLTAAGYTNIDLRRADARSLPFGDETFDVLYSSYMIDLLPLDDMPMVLGEFRRVLKDGGRLVLVNMSKDKKTTLLERFYRITPPRLLPYLYGGCRPVVMSGHVREAGFEDIRREFMKGRTPSEIVVAKKAATTSVMDPSGLTSKRSTRKK